MCAATAPATPSLSRSLNPPRAICACGRSRLRAGRLSRNNRAAAIAQRIPRSATSYFVINRKAPANTKLAGAFRLRPQRQMPMPRKLDRGEFLFGEAVRTARSVGVLGDAEDPLEEVGNLLQEHVDRGDHQQREQRRRN